MKIFARKTLDLVLPPRCGGCGDIIASHAGICASCWSGLEFIKPPFCSDCGIPFPFDVEGDYACGACIESSSNLHISRSVLAYNDESRHLILKYKHGDALYLTPLFAKWLHLVSLPLVTPETLVLPVPLHWTRLFTRTYNQAALLAKPLAQRLELPYESMLLKRTKRTPSQGYRRKKERIENIKNAFYVTDKAHIKDRKILLVDDVYTSGATLQECAKVLKKAGAVRVNSITLARVIKPSDRRF